MVHRVGEPEKVNFRSDRVYQVNGKWFFSTREMTEEGPYDSKKEADAEIMMYIRHAMDKDTYGIK